MYEKTLHSNDRRVALSHIKRWRNLDLIVTLSKLVILTIFIRKSGFVSGLTGFSKKKEDRTFDRYCIHHTGGTQVTRYSSGLVLEPPTLHCILFPFLVVRSCVHSLFCRTRR